MSETKIRYRVNDQGIAEYSDDDLTDDGEDFFETDFLDTASAAKNRGSKMIERIEDLSFFHPSMTRNTCEALLLSNGIEGSFLIRQSGEDQNRYTVSVRYSTPPAGTRR